MCSLISQQMQRPTILRMNAQVDLDDSQLLSSGTLLVRDTSGEELLPYNNQASKARRAINNLNNAVYALLKAELTL